VWNKGDEEGEKERNKYKDKRLKRKIDSMDS
jgi:hypothetical protein